MQAYLLAAEEMPPRIHEDVISLISLIVLISTANHFDCHSVDLYGIYHKHREQTASPTERPAPDITPTDGEMYEASGTKRSNVQPSS
jgi:hypothetical protein